MTQFQATCLASTLNILGLVADLLGAIMIYNFRIKGLGKISPINTGFLTGMLFGGTEGLHAKKFSEELFVKVNETIVASNLANDTAHEKSKKWLLLIFIGIVLQLSGAILQAVPFVD